jgi:hypothetical protein
VKYILKLWKVEDGKKKLICETSQESADATADDYAEAFASDIREAVECNG